MHSDSHTDRNNMSSSVSRACLESDFMISLPKRAEPLVPTATLLRVVQDSATKHELFDSIATLVASKGSGRTRWISDEVGNHEAIIEISFPSSVDQQVFRSLLVTSWKRSYSSLARQIVEIADNIPQPTSLLSMQADANLQSSSAPSPQFRPRASEAGYQLVWQRFLADQSYEYERCREEEHIPKDAAESADEA